jgi:hypothetical protein
MSSCNGFGNLNMNKSSIDLETYSKEEFLELIVQLQDDGKEVDRKEQVMHLNDKVLTQMESADVDNAHLMLSVPQLRKLNLRDRIECLFKRASVIPLEMIVDIAGISCVGETLPDSFFGNFAFRFLNFVGILCESAVHVKNGVFALKSERKYNSDDEEQEKERISRNILLYLFITAEEGVKLTKRQVNLGILILIRFRF